MNKKTDLDYLQCKQDHDFLAENTASIFHTCDETIFYKFFTLSSVVLSSQFSSRA